MKLDKIFDIKFLSIDDYKVKLKCKFFKKNSQEIEAFSSRVICTKGEATKNTKITNYFFIENLKLYSHYDEQTFNVDEHKVLKLTKANFELFPLINGYFSIDSKFKNQKQINKIYNNLCGLLKYYSADTASIRIKYSQGETYQTWSFSPLSPFTKFKNRGIFNDYPGNFFEFVSSSYNKFNKHYNDDNFKHIISYMSYLDREKYLDTEIVLASLILEMFNTFFDKNKDENKVPNLIKGYRNLLKKLNLDESKIDIYFKNNNLCCNYNFLSEIFSIRNNVFHGKPRASVEVFNLLYLFIQIIILKLLESNCFIHTEYDGNINSSVFLNKFLPSETTKCLKYNGKYYLPLNILEDADDLKEDDIYELEVFKRDNVRFFILSEKID